MESATAEMPTQTSAAALTRTFPKARADIDRESVKALSMAGMEDGDLVKRFPSLPAATIRKWRQRDPVWSAVYAATRRPAATLAEATKTVTEGQQELAQATQTAIAETVTKAAGDNLAELHNGTALSLVKASARVLGEFAQSAPVPKDWGEAATAYKVQRLACGIDKEGQQVSLNLTMFSEGHQGETVEGAWEVEGVIETGGDSPDEEEQ